MQLATCPKCSAKLPPDANFCRRCGSVMRTSAARVQPAPLLEDGGPLVSPIPPRKRKSGGGSFWIWVAVAVLGLRAYRTYETPPPKPPLRIPAPTTVTPIPVPHGGQRPLPVNNSTDRSR